MYSIDTCLLWISIYIYVYIYTYIYIYVYIYIYGTPRPKPTFLRSQCFWDKLNTLFCLSSSGGYHIYIYTYVCINCCLTVEPRYLEQFCHQKRSQTFANETGSGFKIQDSKKLLESRDSPGPNPGIQEVFFKILNLES